jgi:mono/diheme cytochrome c family protein
MREQSASWTRVRLLGLALTLLSGLAATAATQESGSTRTSPDAQAAAEGKRIYQRYCAVCHGEDGTGNGPLATELRMPPADLTRLASANNGVFPLQAVAMAIDGRGTTRAHGTPDMPVWGEVFGRTTGTGASRVDSAVARITHYIWSIQRVASD